MGKLNAFLLQVEILMGRLEFQHVYSLIDPKKVGRISNSLQYNTLRLSPFSATLDLALHRVGCSLSRV
jgi:hypothetical protein